MELDLSANIEPLEDNVVMKPATEMLNKTAGGIIIPDCAKKPEYDGIVVAVGKGRYENGQLKPMNVKIGDKILITQHSGIEIRIDGKNYLLVRERNIQAVVK